MAIDVNQKHTTKAVTNDVNLTPTSLVVDETTGRLLISVTIEAAVVAPRDTKIDANQQYIALAEKSDGSSVTPIVTKDDGKIYIDLLVE